MPIAKNAIQGRLNLPVKFGSSGVEFFFFEFEFEFEFEFGCTYAGMLHKWQQKWLPGG